MSKVATVDPVLAEAENSTSTLARYWSRLWPQNGLAWLFVLFALPIVIFFDVTVPPGEVPDEAISYPAHGQHIERRNNRPSYNLPVQRHICFRWRRLR